MARRFLKRLRRDLSDALENDLYVSDVDIVDKLKEQGYLSADDWESINALNRHKKKVKQLLKCLARTENPLETYTQLCELLEKGHKHLVPKVKSILDGYRNTIVYRDKLCEERRLSDVRVASEHDEKGGHSDYKSTQYHTTCKTGITSKTVTRAKAGHSFMISTEMNDLNKNTHSVLPRYDNYFNRPNHQVQSNTGFDEVIETQLGKGDVLNPGSFSCENTEPSSEGDSDSQKCDISVCEIPLEKGQLHHPCLHKCIHSKQGQNSSGIVLSQCEEINNSYPSCRFISFQQKTILHTSAKTDLNLFNKKCQLSNFPNTPPNVREPLSDVECNIHQGLPKENSCPECKGRVSYNFCDEHSNYFIRISSKGSRTADSVLTQNLRTDCISDTDCNVHVNDERHLSCSECSRCQSDSSMIKSTNNNLKRNKYCKETIGFDRILSANETVVENSHSNNNFNILTYVQRTSISSELTSLIKTHTSTSEDFSESSSRLTSESEINTDVNQVHLGTIETKMFRNLQTISGSLSDFMDNMVEQGKLNDEDILSINAQTSERRKMVLLAKLMCKPSGLKEHDEMTLCSPTLSEDDHLFRSESQMLIYKYPMAVIKNFDSMFDMLIDKVNNGYLDVSMLPTRPEEQCITYYLQACDKLYHNNIDTVEILIERAGEAAIRSKHQVQLQGDIFTARTWLYLVTGRIGKMLECLQEHEQLLAFMPGIWSSNAYGWFYHDYARCFLQLQSYSNKKHHTAKEYYKRRALDCARRSIEYFKNSDNSDGPIGIGFASSLLIDALLEVDCLDFSEYKDISKADIDQAKNILNYVEEQFRNKLPLVLKTSYLLNKCDICYRQHQYQVALGYAEECFKLCSEMEIHRNLNSARKRIHTLKSLVIMRHCRTDCDSNLSES